MDGVEITARMKDAVLAASANTIRLRTYAAVLEVPGITGREVAERIEMPFDRVRYQLRRLRESGLIEVVDRKAVRGTNELAYEAVGPGYLDESYFVDLSQSEASRIQTEVLKLIFDDVAAALSAGALVARPEHAIIRQTPALDAQGWRRLSEIHHQTMADIESLEAECEERLSRSGEQPIQAISALMCFERGPVPGEQGDEGA